MKWHDVCNLKYFHKENGGEEIWQVYFKNIITGYYGRQLISNKDILYSTGSDSHYLVVIYNRF